MTIPSGSCELSASPTRVLKVVTNFTSGGTEGQVRNLACALDRSRFDLQFGCLKKWGPLLADLEQRNISTHEFPIGTFYHPKTYRQIWKMARFMRNQRIEVSHSYNFYSNLVTVPAARIAGVPFVVASIRDRGAYLSPKQTIVQKWTCALADRVLVNADAIRDWLVDQGVNADKISLIKNGIDVSRYEFPTLTSDIKLELGIPAGARLVIMLARLNPQKGIGEFLHAAREVRSSHPDVHFLVVGEALGFQDGVIFRDHEYQKDLKTISEELGISDCTWFTGHRTDVPSLLSQSTVSVLPSHSEGLSNSLIESMAAGLPLVATEVGGNPELVKHGVNGLLVPVQDVTALAAAINNILGDPKLASDFGRASRQLCKEQFSMQRMARSTEEIYLSGLAKRSQPGLTRRML